MTGIDAETVADAVDWIGLRAEYETTSVPVRLLCRKYGTSYSSLYARVHSEGWKLRCPRRVDKGDLIERMLRIIEIETEDREMKDDKATGTEAATLNRLATTLDKLISLQTAEQKPPRRRATKAIEDIRKKVADRLIELNAK
jgi:hypothetical protein